MEKNNKELSAKIAQLTSENASLKLQLQKARSVIEAIKVGNIDALVIAHKKNLKIYTEATALKPAMGNSIPVLMSVNPLLLESNRILSVILTDISIQKEGRVEKKGVLIEKIINVIAEMNFYSDEKPKLNHSTYISKQLKHNYTYLAHIFSAAKGLTIQQFIIISKIEKAKELLLIGQLNLTEISYKLHYSSVAHLSGQFKKIIGFSPSSYLKLKQKEYGKS